MHQKVSGSYVSASLHPKPVHHKIAYQNHVKFGSSSVFTEWSDDSFDSD